MPFINIPLINIPLINILLINIPLINIRFQNVITVMYITHVNCYFHDTAYNGP